MSADLAASAKKERNDSNDFDQVIVFYEESEEEPSSGWLHGSRLSLNP